MHPAPWHCGIAPEETIPTRLIGADGLIFCRIVGRTDEEANELAWMIRAAPELLSSCKWLVGQLQGDSGTGHSHWEQFPEYRAACAAIRQASPNTGHAGEGE